MPGEKPTPPEVREAQESRGIIVAAEMRAAHPKMAEYLDAKVEALQESAKYWSSQVKKGEESKREQLGKKYEEEYLPFSKDALNRAAMEAFEAKEARRDFEKGETHPAAEILLKDIKHLFFEFDTACGKGGDSSRVNEVRKNIKESLLVLSGLLDHPSIKI